MGGVNYIFERKIKEMVDGLFPNHQKYEFKINSETNKPYLLVLLEHGSFEYVDLNFKIDGSVLSGDVKITVNKK